MRDEERGAARRTRRRASEGRKEKGGETCGQRTHPLAQNRPRESQTHLLLQQVQVRVPRNRNPPLHAARAVPLPAPGQPLPRLPLILAPQSVRVPQPTESAIVLKSEQRAREGARETHTGVTLAPVPAWPPPPTPNSCPYCLNAGGNELSCPPAVLLLPLVVPPP